MHPPISLLLATSRANPICFGHHFFFTSLPSIFYHIFLLRFHHQMVNIYFPLSHLFPILLFPKLLSLLYPFSINQKGLCRSDQDRAHPKNPTSKLGYRCCFRESFSSTSSYCARKTEGRSGRNSCFSIRFIYKFIYRFI